MGVKTKIDWCDASWNPVTGCLHGCEYCYARKIAERFGGGYRHDSEPPDKSWRWWKQRSDSEYDAKDLVGDHTYHANGQNHVLEEVCFSYPCRPSISPPEDDPSRKKAPYPYFFDPTFHRYRLDEPQHCKKPKIIFVCSMADLMGRWVPDCWKQDVIAACKAAPQHRYLFLTKNPYGYGIIPHSGHDVEHELNQDNFWLGCSMTGREDLSRYDGHYGRYLYAMGGNMIPGGAHRFISIEPILTDVMALPGYSRQYSALQEIMIDHMRGYAGNIEWIIVGAETGNRKGKIIPERAWIEKIAEACSKYGLPIFMKESLRDVMGDDFRQEFPWGCDNG